MRRRVLVLTRDLIPVPGKPTSGGGLRAWGLGEALRQCGHDVVYSVPRKLVPDGDSYDELRRLAFESNDLHTTILRAEPDVLLLEQWGLATHLEDSGLPVVLDLHGSLILENAFRQHRSWTSNAAAKIKALRKADLVLCPGYRQKAYFMAWMMMAGADPTDIPVEVVPVSMPPEQPVRTADNEQGPLTLVYGGQLWPWIQPGAALTMAARLLEELEAGTLHLFVNQPAQQEVLPYDDSTRIPTWHLPEAVTQSRAVRREGMLPRDEMILRYAASHLAVDCYTHNTERELAFTTRTVEYMWCGLPVIYGHYGELSQLISAYDAGWIVNPNDPASLEAALRAAITDRAELRRRSENARKLVRELLSFDRTVQPLDRYVSDPVTRQKGETIFGKLSLEFDRLRGEAGERIEELEKDLKNLVDEVANRDSRIVALTDELTRRERLTTDELEQARTRVRELDRERTRLEELLREAQLQTDRQNLEVSERDREIRKLKAELSEARARGDGLARDAEEARELLACEQRDHAQTVALYGSLRNDLSQSEQRGRDLTTQLQGVQVDLKGAVTRLASQSEDLERCRKDSEAEIKALQQREQELRRDLAAEAAQTEELRAQLEQAGKAIQGQKDLVAQMHRRLHELRNSWVERGAVTSEHALKRIAVQVPTLAGLWVRNLANNAYMTVWQKRHNVRIFPGQ